MPPHDLTDEQKRSDADAPDRSQYIRTMAKDMATLTGGATSKTIEKIKQAQKEERSEQGVVLPHVEESFFSRPEPQTREIYNEPLEIPRVEELSSAIEHTADPQPLPPAPEPEPVPEIPRAQVERASILDRLRRKVGEHARMDIESYPSAAPEFEKVNEEPLPPPLPVPKPLPPPPPPPAPKIESLASPLHTYSSDFADHIDSNKASTFSVLAAQQDAKRTEPVRVKTKTGSRPLTLAAVAIVLVVLGGAGIFGAYTFVATKNTVSLSPFSVPSLVSTDAHVEVRGTGPELLQAIETAATGNAGEGKVLVLHLSSSNTDSKGVTQTEALPGGSLIAALQLPAPDILLRNVNLESTVGAINVASESRVFFVLRTTSYERTFAGMLTWEPSIARDLAALYPAYSSDALVPDAVTVPSSSAYASATFVDAIVANHDVRILRDSAGRSILLYGYTDKETLIIARNEAAFTALLARLKP
ncbi:MAG: protein of unknown function with transrane region [Parcubacteria group bacterium]|nr:protein of unknown function with transrane region [Parcubacteria group bacterium]